MDVYLEIGAKRTFAGAIEWPGWCRSGRSEAAALQALVDYRQRYAAVLRPAGIEFAVSKDVSELQVVERLPGNRTTDFGAPDMAPAGDGRPVNAAELFRFQALLRACWQAFDVAVKQAEGRELRKGPRGGGRDVDKIIGHVIGAEGSYLSRIGGRLAHSAGDVSVAELTRIRQTILDTLAAAARGELPERGPRGGRHWTPRYFVRRAAWHVLDHTWEIEDRLI